ncbi:hypothetical protein UlMin_002200 [Ulmus minor]
MSSDLSVFDGSFYHYSSSEMVSLESELLFDDQFSPLSDSAIEILQSLSDNPTQQNPVEESNSFEPISPSFLSSSPPSHQLESLSLCQTTHLQDLSNSPNFSNGFGNFSVLDGFQVKTEECHLAFDNGFSQTFAPHSYSGAENETKLMQRNCSFSFDGKPGFLFPTHFDSFMQSPSFQNQNLSSPESNFLDGQMRRACSTGDLQSFTAARTTQRCLSSPLASESSFMEEGNLKVGKYSAEERKEKISKYRAKRTLRNFNKTIKYACRKTLADNRPRIRGRFARNDEPCEIPKASCSTREEEELWLEGLHEEEEDNETVRGQFVNSYGPTPTQFQYYGF